MTETPKVRLQKRIRQMKVETFVAHVEKALEKTKEFYDKMGLPRPAMSVVENEVITQFMDLWVRYIPMVGCSINMSRLDHAPWWWVKQWALRQEDLKVELLESRRPIDQNVSDAYLYSDVQTMIIRRRNSGVTIYRKER